MVKGSPASLVTRLWKRKGKHILLMGGGELGRAFLKADLVDELAIGIVPVLLGEGIPGFPSGFPQRKFSLVSCQAFSKDSVGLIYRRVSRK
jgi:dihydrofolate reductase